MDITWDGITRAETFAKESADVRHALADAAKSYNWPRVFALIAEHQELVNSTRPDGSSLFAPLHQAAHGGAPVEVIQKLVNMGAWRTLRNAHRERAVDVAIKAHHRYLIAALEPVYKHFVPFDILLKIQNHFHAVINARAGKLVRGRALRLPELEPLLELDRPQMWFPIPGMYGGFSYRLEAADENAKLVSESWCRVVGGSGQRHLITSEGSVLEEEGFV